MVNKTVSVMITSLFFISMLLLAGPDNAVAWWWQKPKDEPTPAKATPAKAPAKPAATKLSSEEQKAVLMGEAKQYLKGKTILVYTTLVEDGSAKKKGAAAMGTDTLTFTERRVASKNLAAMGYAATGSNYSITGVGLDGSFTWETMQKHENGEDIANLRGDVSGDVMTGSIDIKSVKSGRKVYRFTTLGQK